MLGIVLRQSPQYMYCVGPNPGLLYQSTTAKCRSTCYATSYLATPLPNKQCCSCSLFRYAVTVLGTTHPGHFLQSIYSTLKDVHSVFLVQYIYIVISNVLHCTSIYAVIYINCTMQSGILQKIDVGKLFIYFQYKKSK
jgi:hypothetical protein